MATTRILIIDDDVFVRDLYRGVLKQESFEVLEADNGERGLLLAIKEHPDLILLDLQLPKLHGLDVLTKIRQEGSLDEVPILILSSRGEKTDVATGLQKGADGYAVKGYERPKQVVDKIRALLNRGRQKAFFVLPMPGQVELATLAQNLKLSRDFVCPKCQKPLALELSPVPGPSPTAVYSTRIQCPQCKTYMAAA